MLHIHSGGKRNCDGSFVNMLVEAGWFRDLDDLMLDALRRFVESHRGELMERFIREDVEWGLHGDE